MKRILKIKRLTAYFLLIVMLLSCFSVRTPKIINAQSNSNDRRISYIKLMGGAKLTDIDDIGSFTMNDLQVLALFLSNYYKPWGTSLDDNSEIQKSITEQLSKGLQNIGFDETAATQMVNNVYSASLSSSQKIYICLEELAILTNQTYADGCPNAYGFQSDDKLHPKDMSNYGYYWLKVKKGTDGNPDSMVNLEDESTELTFAIKDTNLRKDYRYFSIPSYVDDFNGDGNITEADVSLVIEHMELIPISELPGTHVSCKAGLYRGSLSDTDVGSKDAIGIAGGENDPIKGNNDYVPALELENMVNDTVGEGDFDGYNSYVGRSIKKNGYLGGKKQVTLTLMLQASTKRKGAYNGKASSLSSTKDLKVSKLTYVPLTTFIYNTIMTCFSNTKESSSTKNAGSANLANIGNIGTNTSLPKAIRANGLMCYYLVGDDISEKPCLKINNTYVAMYSSCLANQVKTDYAEKGYMGNAAMLTNIKEGKESSGTLTNEALSTYSIFTQNMYIDWVGNVIADVGDKRVIVLPACINSCGFTTLGEKRNPNFVSTWGLHYLSTYGTYNKTKDTVIVSDKTVDDLKYRQTHGKTDYPKFDFNDGSGGAGGDGQKYRTFLQSINVKVPNSDDENDWYNSATGSKLNIGLTILPRTNKKSNSLHQFLMYKAIENDNIELDSDSSFLAGSVISSDIITSNYFSDKEKFKSSSTKYDALIDFGDNANDKAMLQHIFLTYLYAYNYQDKKDSSDSDALIDMKFNPSTFPSCDGSTTFEIDKEALKEETQNQIQSFIYYLLHPSEGLSYVSTLFKNKVSGIIIGWHEDIVGSSNSNSTTGMTQYLGFTGYTTLPNLYDVSWVSWLLAQYDNIVVYLIILIALVLVCYIIVGQMTIQRAILGVLTFSVLAFLPPIAINTVVNYSNTICNSIYSSKFDYWALCQLQTYLGQLNNVTNAETVEDYVSSLMQIEVNQGAGGQSETGYAGVKLKWMSPKKFNELGEVEDEMNNSLTKTSTALTNVALNTISSQTSGESFLQSDSALYLYRDYCDIYRYASMSANIYTLSPGLIFYDSVLNPTEVVNVWSPASGALRTINYSSGESYMQYVTANDENHSNNIALLPYIKDTSSIQAIRRGFLINTLGIEDSDLSNKQTYWSSGTSATTLCVKYNKVYEKIKTRYDNYLLKVNDKINLSDNLSLSNDIANDGIYFGLSYEDFAYKLDEIKDINVTEDAETINTIDKNLSYWYYGLYSESPFYFFSANVYDQMKALTSYSYDYNSLESSMDNFKSMLLRKNQGYFFNIEKNAGDGYGELRDFMNFHDFFYYILPLMQQGNNLVVEFDELYGMYAYEDINLKFNEGGSLVFDGIPYADLDTFAKSTTVTDEGVECTMFEAMDDEMRYKFWHNYNVYTIFNMYTTWLDTMMDCDYADSETITVMGEKYNVTNPLDPTTYFEVNEAGDLIAGRYMIFSKSEQRYYGLNDSDLTAVERKLIDVAENVYGESLDLMNYYTLSDETLIQAFAMIQLFEFNKEFSQTSLVSEDFVLYPQSYELKAFTYDAYLRLIISGSTGDALMTSQTSSSSSSYSDTSSDTSGSDSDSSSEESTEESSEDTTEAGTTEASLGNSLKNRLLAGLDTLFGEPIQLSAKNKLPSKKEKSKSEKKKMEINRENNFNRKTIALCEKFYIDSGLVQYYGGETTEIYKKKIAEYHKDVLSRALTRFRASDKFNYKVLSKNKWDKKYWEALTKFFARIISEDKEVISEKGAAYFINGFDPSTITTSYDDSDIESQDTSVDTESSDTSNQVVNTNGPVELSSLYHRVISKTSIFFGIVLLINDFLAVYLIPALKLFFLIALFFLAVSMIIAEAFKMEFNFATVVWKSLFAPLLSFAGVSIGMAWIVSLFMTNGADGVTKSNIVISMGDPTMVLIVMTVINAVAIVLYFKICKKCFQDLIKYGKAIFDSSFGAVTGAIGKVAGVITAGKASSDLAKVAKNTSAGGLGRGGLPASSPEHRGKDNAPSPNGSVSSMLAGAGMGAGVATAANTANETPRVNPYDEKIASIDRNIEENKAKIDNVNSKRKKTKMELNQEAAAEANKTATEGLAAFKNKDLGIRERIDGGKKAVKGSISAGINETKAGVRSALTKGTGQTRLDRFINGTGENRGLSASDVKARADARKDITEAGRQRATLVNKRNQENNKLNGKSKQNKSAGGTKGRGANKNKKKNRKRKK